MLEYCVAIFMDQKLLILIFVVGVIMLVLGYIFLSREKEQVNIPKEGNIIFFGDSLVEGVGASSGNDLPSQLSARIGLPIINAGKSGDTTSSALTRLERDVLSKQPRLVIILLGGNDALQQIPAQQVFQNLATMIDRILEQKAGVLLLGVRGGILEDPYKKMFEDLAKEKRIFYIPNILDNIIGNPDLMSDPIHPNDKGYKIMAYRIEPLLRKILDQ